MLHINSLQTRDTIERAIEAQRPRSGLTHTAEAFERALELLTTRPGLRADGRTPAYVLHVSDGMASDYPAAARLAERIRLEPNTTFASVALATPFRA